METIEDNDFLSLEDKRLPHSLDASHNLNTAWATYSVITKTKVLRSLSWAQLLEVLIRQHSGKLNYKITVTLLIKPSAPLSVRPSHI